MIYRLNWPNMMLQIGYSDTSLMTRVAHSLWHLSLLTLAPLSRDTGAPPYRARTPLLTGVNSSLLCTHQSHVGIGFCIWILLAVGNLNFHVFVWASFVCQSGTLVDRPTAHISTPAVSPDRQHVLPLQPGTCLLSFIYQCVHPCVGTYIVNQFSTRCTLVSILPDNI